MKILPASLGNKVVAILSYIVVAIGLFLAFTYFMGPSGACTATNRGELTSRSIIIGIIQLVASLGLLALVRGLNKHTSAIYSVVTIVAACVLLVLQLFFAMGYAFAIGTACTT
jgi:hypothetical protein